MKIRKCKNGSFFVKREPEYDTPADDEDFGRGLNLVFDLVNSSGLDFEIAGDEGCADNFHMYYPLYNHFTGLLYLPTDYECADYLAGKTVWIPGRKLDGYDLLSLLDETCLSRDHMPQFDVWQLDCLLDPESGWIENERFLLDSVYLTEWECLSDVLRLLRGQLSLDLYAPKFRLAEETETSFEIHYRHQDKPFLLFTLRPEKED